MGRRAICAAGRWCGMARLQKCGPHGILRTPEVLDWIRYSPVVKSVDNTYLLAHARPDALKWFRHYFAHQDINRNGADAAAEVLEALGAAPCDIISLYNETAQHLWEGLARHIEFTREAVEYVRQVRPDLVVAAFSFSTGCPGLDDWEYLQDHDFGGADLIEIHEYFGREGFTPWHAVRHRTVHELLGGDHPPFIVGEGGIDAIEGGTRGWQRTGISGEQYRQMLINYDGEIAKDDYVVAWTPFTSGPTTDWADFRIDGVIQPSDYQPAVPALTIPKYEREVKPMEFHGRFAAMAAQMGDRAGQPGGFVLYNEEGDCSQPSTTGAFHYDSATDIASFTPASHQMGPDGVLVELPNPFASSPE